MANPAITRAQVHDLAEACSDAGDDFQSTAMRLVKEQRRVSRFVEQNMEPLGPLAGQVSLYMLTVCLRVFEQMGGRLTKVSGKDLNEAMVRVNEVAEQLMPADDQFFVRARAIEGRAQPHLLDEILWALYERNDEERSEDESDIDPRLSAMIYLLLWPAVEAIDANWRPPAGWDPSTYVSPAAADGGDE